MSEIIGTKPGQRRRIVGLGYQPTRLKIIEIFEENPQQASKQDEKEGYDYGKKSDNELKNILRLATWSTKTPNNKDQGI